MNYKQLFHLLLLVMPWTQSLGQSNKPTPTTITSAKELALSVKADPDKQLVNISRYINGIVIAMPYSTKDNFTHAILYNKPIAYMRKPAAEALLKIHQELNKQGLELKIYDAYRPLSVTRKIWDMVHDNRYAANPVNGSAHNRALAVDLTVINRQTGQELDMGTGFDNFTDTAHHSFKHLPNNVKENRKLLKTIMTQYGFRPLSTEWWHYSWPDDKNYELLDIDFEAIEGY